MGEGRCCILSNKLKKMLYAKIRDYKEQLIDILYLKEQLKTISSLEEINLLNLLKIENQNKFIKCIFFEGFSGWISVNSQDKQRYFTQKGKKKYALDIYDILEIYYNCSYNQIFNKLLEQGFECTPLKSDYSYVSNYIYLNEPKSSFIRESLSIYNALLDFNKTHSILNKGSNIFFISTRFLKEQYKLPYSISTINQIINMYDFLGLINKVDEKDILNENIKNCLKLKKAKKNISFYEIKEIENLSLISEKRRILFEEKISYHNLSGRNKKNLILKYKMLFNNKEKGEILIKENKSDLERTISAMFENYLNTKGIVAKEWLFKDLEVYNKSKINKYWIELIKINEGRSIKPNKKIKAQFNLLSNQNIFIVKKLTI